MRARLSNPSPIPRKDWVAVAVPHGYLGEQFYDFVTDRGLRLPAVRGEFVGRHSVIYRIEAPLDANQFLDGEFREPTIEPKPFRLHPWVTDDVSALICRGVVQIDGVNHTVQKWDVVNLEHESPAHQQFYLRGWIKGGFVCEVWITLTSNNPVAMIWGQITWSNRNDPAHDKTIDGVGIQSGEMISVDYRIRNGHSEPRKVDGKWRVVLAAPAEFIDGSGIPFKGRMLCAPSDQVFDDEEAFASLMSAYHSQTWGVAEWPDDSWLAFGVTPGYLDDMRELSRSAFEEHLRQPGHIYDDRLLGLTRQPGRTGDQEDFGAAKGTIAIGATWDPRWLEEAAHSVYADAFRGLCHYENKGKSRLQASDHPAWRTWSGYTHWNQGVSPDRLGKGPTFFGARMSTGWEGMDDQHRSQNNLAAYYALTADPLVGSLLRHQVQTDAAMLDGRVGAPRAVGRLLLTWAHLSDLLDEKSRDIIQGRMEEKVHIVHKSLQRGPRVTVIGTNTDPRMGIIDRNGQPLEAWSVWEHGLAVIGLWAASRVLDDPIESSRAEDVAREIGRSIFDHAFRVRSEGGYQPIGDSVTTQVLAADTIAWMDGEGIDDADYNEDDQGAGEDDLVTLNPYPISGVSTWTFYAMPILAKLIDEPAYRVRVQALVNALTPQHPSQKEAEWLATT